MRSGSGDPPERDEHAQSPSGPEDGIAEVATDVQPPGGVNGLRAPVAPHGVFGTSPPVHGGSTVSAAHPMQDSDSASDAYSGGCRSPFRLMPITNRRIQSMHMSLGIISPPAVYPTTVFVEVFPSGFVGALVLDLLGAECIGASFKRNCLKQGKIGWWYIAAWIIVPSITLVSASMILKAGLHASRYLVWVAPGLCLLGGCAIGSIQQSRIRQISIAMVAATLLVAFGSRRSLLPRHGKEDWRAALASVAKHGQGEGAVILFQVPYLESRAPDWAINAYPSGFLMSPLAAYPVSGRIFALPTELSPTVAPYMEKLSSETLVHSRKLILLERLGANHSVWLEGRLSPFGFRSTAVENYGGIEVSVLDRPFSIQSVNSLRSLASPARRN
jgi:hypothetical protein